MTLEISLARSFHFSICRRRGSSQCAHRGQRPLFSSPASSARKPVSPIQLRRTVALLWCVSINMLMSYRKFEL